MERQRRPRRRRLCISFAQLSAFFFLCVFGFAFPISLISGTMLSKVLGFFAKQGKQLAGTDKAGNCYYRQLQNRDGTVSERRWVEFGGSAVVDPIPVEWNSWLNGRRKEPPTPEEMKELELRRQAIKARTALLEKEEEKRRYRAKALQQGMNEDDVSPHGVTRFLQQVSESGGPAKQSDAQQATQSQPTFEPDAWNPSLPPTKSGEAEGSGGMFKPGTWKP